MDIDNYDPDDELRADIESALHKVEAGYSPASESQRLNDERIERWKEQDREMEAWRRAREPGYDDMGRPVGIWWSSGDGDD